MRKITCTVCGCSFIPESRRSCYCCLGCRVEGERRKRKEWRDRNKEKIKQRNAIYWQNRKRRLAAAAQEK